MTKSSSWKEKRHGIVNEKSSILTVAAAIVLIGAIFVLSYEDVSVSAAKGGIPGKSTEVQMNSDGFPSGPHINLNIHGRDYGWTGCQDVEGPPTSDDNDLGNNVNAPINGTGDILFVSNQKSTNPNMTVWDNCTQDVNDSDTDPAKVQIPPNEDGWYVYWRMQAGNNNNKELANVTFTPNLNLLAMCNDNSTTSIVNFSEFNDCQDMNDDLIMPIAQVHDDGIFSSDGEKITKWDQIGKGKNRQLAADVTDLFMWTGNVCNANLDSDGDGTLELSDFDVTNSTGGEPDGIVNATDLDALIDAGLISGSFTDGADIVMQIDENGNEEIDEDEFTALLELINECLVFDEPIWVFDAADIVEHGLEYDNKGSKLTQLRFYNASATNVIRD